MASYFLYGRQQGFLATNWRWNIVTTFEHSEEYI